MKTCVIVNPNAGSVGEVEVLRERLGRLRGIPVAPQSRLDDGRLDVMIAPSATIPQLALLVPQVLLGRHAESDLLLFRKAARIEIESDPPMTFNLDGELIGEGPIRFEVKPRTLAVVVGPTGRLDETFEGKGLLGQSRLIADARIR